MSVIASNLAIYSSRRSISPFRHVLGPADRGVIEWSRTTTSSLYCELLKRRGRDGQGDSEMTPSDESEVPDACELHRLSYLPQTKYQAYVVYVSGGFLQP